MEDLVFIQQFINNGLPEGELYVNAEVDTPEVGQSTIKGVAISNKSNTGLDLTNVMQSLDRRIILNYPDNGSFIKVNLTVISKSKHVSAVGPSTFFYFKVQPQIVDTTILGDAEISIAVSLEPFIQDRQQVEYYDVLQANAQPQRLGRFQQIANNTQPYVADNRVFPLPQNIENLIEGTADSAETVTSNYTKKGWINARYEGSLTGLVDFQGIPAYTSFREFQGIPYIDTIQVNTIDSNYLQTLEALNLVHTGIKDLPEVAVSEILSNSPQTITATSTLLDLDNSLIGSRSIKLIPNQLLKLTVGLETELVRFLSIETITETVTRVNVVRNLDRETALAGSVIRVDALDPCQIFRTDSNKLSPLANSWTFVAGINTYFRTDKLGFVFQQVTPESN